jgi:hypothetical protein
VQWEPEVQYIIYIYYISLIKTGGQGAENIWTKEGWSDGRVEKAA